MTRDGWWCVFAATGLGIAAVNTGNNLAYLLCSMVLAIILVSGALSVLTMLGVRPSAILPEEIFAGLPAVVGVVVTNRKRWLASYSLNIEVLGTGGRATVTRVLHVPWLGPGGERLCTWDVTLPARGRRRLPGLRITTRFPFGLFVKMGPVMLESEVLVYPAVTPLAPERLREVGGSGDTTTRRRGRGHDLYNLRQYLPGDDPHLIHWRSSAKAATLTVRELEEDTTLDTRLVLEGTGVAYTARFEAGLSEAASLAVHLLRAGAGVELVGPGVWVPPGRGRDHEVRLLTALALYDPEERRGSEWGDGPLPETGGVPPAAVREIRVQLA